MLKRRLRLNFDRCLVLVTVLVGLALPIFPIPSLAQSSDQENAGDYDNPEGLVELHIKADPYATYENRRENWSWRFNTQWEQFYPNSYVSTSESSNYAGIFGSNQGTIISIGIGAQYNTRLGAFYLDGIYGSGAVSASINGSSVLKISKYGAAAGILLDTLFKNPYVSPFIGIQAINFNWNDISSTANAGGTTAITIATVAGISIHMNQVEPAASAEAYINYGLRNTFIDIYGIQYNTSNSSQDPDLQTTWNIGAGFHLEF